MATILVSGVTKADAPSPLVLKGWQEDWSSQLANLTPWIESNAGTMFTCGSTSPLATVQSVVTPDLQRWSPNGVGRRSWSVSA